MIRWRPRSQEAASPLHIFATKMSLHKARPWDLGSVYERHWTNQEIISEESGLPVTNYTQYTIIDVKFPQGREERTWQEGTYKIINNNNNYTQYYHTWGRDWSGKQKKKKHTK